MAVVGRKSVSSHCCLFSGENLYIIDNNRYQEEDDTYAELQQINKIVSMRKWSKNDEIQTWKQHN